MKAKAYETVTRTVFKAVGKVQNASPTILSFTAVGGLFATSILTAKGTFAVSKELEKEKPDKKVVIKEYAPAVFSGIATTVCILGSNHINQKTKASLLSAYALLNESYRRYQEKVTETVGEDTEKEIRSSIAKDEYSDLPEMNVKNENELLFYDEFSNRYFVRTMLEVADAEYHFNRNLALRGYASLNELYKFLGLTETKYGETVGWNLYLGNTEYGYQWVDFEHQLFEEPCDPDSPSFYLIHMPFPPHTGYLD